MEVEPIIWTYNCQAVQVPPLLQLQKLSGYNNGKHWLVSWTGSSGYNSGGQVYLGITMVSTGLSVGQVHLGITMVSNIVITKYVSSDDYSHMTWHRTGLVWQIELATNEFPYSKWQTPFEQIKQVVMEDPPQLPPGRFSPEFEDFVVQW